MLIGRLSIAHPWALAPLEEHSNLPFRQLCRKLGAGLVCGERLDACDIVSDDRRAKRMLATIDSERPCLAQFTTQDPAQAAEAARCVEAAGWNIVELNCDCPVNRVAGKGAGGALMADPAAIGNIIQAMVQAVSIPVSVKLRTGPNDENPTCFEAAARAQDAGAGLVHLHARSVAAGYRGTGDWDLVAKLRESLQIPLMASGGIRTAQDAIACKKSSGVALIAFARAALVQPWIFRAARALEQGTVLETPSWRERGRWLQELLDGESRLYGREKALKRAPRLISLACQAHSQAAAIREAIADLRRNEDLRILIDRFWR